MVKKRVSATIGEQTERDIDFLLKDSTYRNKSHVIEKAIELLKKEAKEKGGGK